MPLVSIREELQKAQAGSYAVPLFDVFEMQAIEGVFAAIQEKHAPAIVAIYAQFVEAPNARALAAYIRCLAEQVAAPVSLMLDHGASFEQCIRALRYGFTDVMYDGSSLPLDQNLTTTRLVVQAAHAVGVGVEAELGHVGRGDEYKEFGSQGKGFTDPDTVERFVGETEVDCLAVAIGTAHGLYDGVPRLDLERLCEIRRRVDTPLVLHGGTGLSEEQFRAAIAAGVVKINIATDLGVAASKAMIEAARATSASYLSVMGAVREAYRQRAGYYLDLFGVTGRA